MRVYHFVNRQHGLQDLQRRRLKVATVDELNDPFELLGFASKDPWARRLFLDFKTEFGRSTGLLCFSGHWRNPVQWSHYAERHRGLCLGFDVTAPLTPVTYASKRISPNLSLLNAGGQTAEQHMLQMLTTKFSHWRYENEYRLFISLSEKDASGLYFFGFCDELVLREVIVGHNSSISRTELNEALGDIADGVDVFKARLAFQSFRIVRQKCGNLWK